MANDYALAAGLETPTCSGKLKCQGIPGGSATAAHLGRLPPFCLLILMNACVACLHDDLGSNISCVIPRRFFDLGTIFMQCHITSMQARLQTPPKRQMVHAPSAPLWALSYISFGSQVYICVYIASKIFWTL